MQPIRVARTDLAVRDAISWHDQGALIWAIQNTANEHRMLQDIRWNLCVRHSPAVLRKSYVWGKSVIDELRADEPSANLLHWNGYPVPWLR
jgi:hypothetical protein